MGLKTSPSAFRRLMEFVFHGFKNSVIYLDDVLVGSKTWEDHIRHLEDSFCRLQRYNLKLNLKKCIFAASVIEYVGYTISAGSIKPGKEKTQAVQEFPAPKSVKEIRRFTGLTNYCRAFIPGYAKLAGKLSRLLAKETGWGGGDLPSDALEVFKCLCDKLTQAPILAFPQEYWSTIYLSDRCFSRTRSWGSASPISERKKSRDCLFFQGIKGAQKELLSISVRAGRRSLCNRTLSCLPLWHPFCADVRSQANGQARQTPKANPPATSRIDGGIRFPDGLFAWIEFFFRRCT